MKTVQRFSSVFFVILITTILLSCEKLHHSDPLDPFRKFSMERDLIVVISDMHLGADLAYAECKDNLPALEEFLTQIRESSNVKELVIAGDLLDEWFVPAPINTYQGKDQSDFVKRIAETNKGVFNVLKRIIRERKILVTYVPGNHDLTITEENVDLILPGIKQKRDPELGLGTYSPEGYPKIVIEHGHRYNFFCSPDPFSNQDIAPGTILPPGYFFTRIAALYVSQGHPTVEVVIPPVTPNTSGDESQNLLFSYFKLWEWTLNMFTIENNFNEDIIVTNIDKFNGTYSVNDLLPYQETPGGFIDVNLYNGIQENWVQRQEHNHVLVPIPAQQAIAGSALASETDNQAAVQYILNPKSNVRIVVFGHSHVPTMISSFDHLNQKSIYVNSGTWIDDNPNRTTMNFVVITPQKGDCCSKTHVRLYNFENEVITLMAEDSVRL